VPDFARQIISVNPGCAIFPGVNFPDCEATLTRKIREPRGFQEKTAAKAAKRLLAHFPVSWENRAA